MPDLHPIIEEIVFHRSSTLNLLLVMVIIWSTGVVCRKIKQPPLLGELLAGIIFGPSLLGIIRPDETLTVLSELGVFFLMFYAGLESNFTHLNSFRKKAITVGIYGYLLPFIVGYFVSRAFGQDLIQALFIGQALSITAIAVSARVLHDMRLTDLRLAPVVIGAGIIDDIMALTVFTTLVEMASNGNTFYIMPTLISLLKVILFFAVSGVIGRWIIPKMEPYLSAREAKGFSFALIVALLFGFLAEISGLHLIIGAYIAGLFVRLSISSEDLFEKINDRFVSITYGFIGPIFFFCLSFHVTFQVIQTHTIMLLTLLATAIFTKFAGAFFGAKNSGLNSSESTVIGIIMNGRGAVELIIASVGLEMGLINDDIFSILVMIAFITTLMPPLTLRLSLKALKDKLEHIKQEQVFL